MNGHYPQPTIADFVILQVLALSYTAHDLAPFARDLGVPIVRDQDIAAFGRFRTRDDALSLRRRLQPTGRSG